MKKTVTEFKAALAKAGITSKTIVKALVDDATAKGEIVADGAADGRPLASELRKALTETVGAEAAERLVKARVAAGEVADDAGHIDLSAFDDTAAELADLAKAGKPKKKKDEEDDELDDTDYGDGQIVIEYADGVQKAADFGGLQKALGKFIDNTGEIAGETRIGIQALAKAGMAQMQLQKAQAGALNRLLAENETMRADIGLMKAALRVKDGPRAVTAAPGAEVSVVEHPGEIPGQGTEAVTSRDMVAKAATAELVELRKAGGGQILDEGRAAQLSDAMSLLDAQGNPDEIASEYGIKVEGTKAAA